MIPLPLIDGLALHGRTLAGETGRTPAQIRKAESRREAAAERRRARAAEEAGFNRLVYMRAMVARARISAHGIDPGPPEVLAITVVGLIPLEKWFGTPDERALLGRAVALANRCSAAALEHPDVAAYLADPELRAYWSAADVAKNPPIRLRYEEASVVGQLGSALSASAEKNWGPCVAVEPLTPDVQVDPMRLTFVFHDSSRYNRRFEQRRRMRAKLPRPMRKIVSTAFRSTKREWLKACTPDQAAAIRRRFNLDPREFWQAAKGGRPIEFPREPVQGDLFAGLEV